MVLVVAAACGRGRDAPPRADATTATTPATAAGSSDCVLSDRWESCYVEKRLDNSGLIPTLLDSAVVLPMFAVPARHYRLGRGELYVVLYPDAAARERDVAQLESLTVSPRGGPRHPWPMPPAFFTNANAAVVLLTASEHLTARIDDIFSGGLPQLQRR